MTLGTRTVEFPSVILLKYYDWLEVERLAVLAY